MLYNIYNEFIRPEVVNRFNTNIDALDFVCRPFFRFPFKTESENNEIPSFLVFLFKNKTENRKIHGRWTVYIITGNVLRWLFHNLG